MYEVPTLSVYMEEGLSAQFDIYQLRKWKWTQSVGPKVGSQMREWVSANDVIQSLLDSTWSESWLEIAEM